MTVNLQWGIIKDLFVKLFSFSYAGLYIRAGSRQSSPASLPGFAGYFHCFTSQDTCMSRRWCLSDFVIRSKLLGLDKNENLQCLSFLKTYKRLLTQGQFKNVMLETVLLNKSSLMQWWESTNNMICVPPYWISIHECIISASRKLGRSSVTAWLSAQNCENDWPARSKTKTVSLRSFSSKKTKTKRDNYKWR